MPEGVNLWKRPVQTLSLHGPFSCLLENYMDLLCYGCIVGFHEECNNTTPIAELDGYYKCCCWSEATPAEAIAGGFGVHKRTPKDAEDIRDQTSTGRKRAVAAMDEWGRGLEGSVCEWAYLRNAGGGAVPIVGCNGTTLRLVKKTEDLPLTESPRHVHHGPDKSTLNNGPENLHSICASCHGRWHALNDPHYGERPEGGQPFIPLSGELMPHDPETKATDKERDFSDKFWGLTPAQRKPIQFRVMLEVLSHGGSTDA